MDIPAWQLWKIGDEVLVPAWWVKPKGTLVKCRVKRIQLPWRESSWRTWPGGVDVIPLEGNPHMRYISGDDLK